MDACFQDMELIAKSMDVIEGRAKSVDITMSIHNAQRTFATTLSHVISMYVSHIISMYVYVYLCGCMRIDLQCRSATLLTHLIWIPENSDMENYSVAVYPELSQDNI